MNLNTQDSPTQCCSTISEVLNYY